MVKFDFLISSERSGSNLITKIIDGHSLYCGPASPHLLRVFKPIMSKYGDLTNSTKWDTFINDVLDFFNCKIGIWEANYTKQELKAIKDRSLASVVKYIYKKETCIHSKTNVFIKEVRTYDLVSYINQTFIKPKFIWLVRDPRDMALSWSKSPVHRGDIVRASNIWKYDQRATIDIYKQLKDSKNILLLKYEDLISNQLEAMQMVCNFLDIEFENQMINFYKSKMSITNASKTDNWRNLNKEIISNNSKKYESDLSSDQIQFIEYVCSTEMEYLGYNKDYERLSDNDFETIQRDLLSKERYNKPEYNFISEEEKLKRTKWYDKLLQIQNH
jgi:hypothetical protein